MVGSSGSAVNRSYFSIIFGWGVQGEGVGSLVTVNNISKIADSNFQFNFACFY